MCAEGRGFDSRAGVFPDFSVEVFAVRESIYLSKFDYSTLCGNTLPSLSEIINHKSY